MELRVLRYFLIIAREENITKAAEILHITQPTLSRQIMQLEDELGVKLFKRSRHNIILTEDGMLLKRRAQELITLADKTIDGFSTKDNQIKGEISIGAGEYLSFDFLCTIMNEFHNLYPLIHYDIHSDETLGIEEKIEQGTLDFGVLAENINISKYNYVHLPSHEVWGVLVKEDSNLITKSALQLSDLKDHALIIPKRITQQSEIIHWFNNTLDNHEIIATYNLLYNAAMMVSCGLGIALCIQLKTSYEGLRFIPLAPYLTSNSILVWKKNQVLSPAVTAFIDYLRNAKKA